MVVNFNGGGLTSGRSGIYSSGSTRVGSITAGSSFASSPSQMLRSGSAISTNSAADALEGDVGEEAGTGSSLLMDADPVTAVAQIAQNIGGGLNSIITGIQNYNTNADFVNLMANGHGIGLAQVAQNQAAHSYAKSSLEDIGGKLGALFGGPLGVLAGRGLASLFETPMEGAVAYTQEGKFNPQTGTTPQSQSSTQSGPSILNNATSMDNDNDSSLEMSTISSSSTQADQVAETTV